MTHSFQESHNVSPFSKEGDFAVLKNNIWYVNDESSLNRVINGSSNNTYQWLPDGSVQYLSGEKLYPDSIRLPKVNVEKEFKWANWRTGKVSNWPVMHLLYTTDQETWVWFKEELHGPFFNVHEIFQGGDNIYVAYDRDPNDYLLSGKKLDVEKMTHPSFGPYGNIVYGARGKTIHWNKNIISEYDFPFEYGCIDWPYVVVSTKTYIKVLNLDTKKEIFSERIKPHNSKNYYHRTRPGMTYPWVAWHHPDGIQKRSLKTSVRTIVTKHMENLIKELEDEGYN